MITINVEIQDSHCGAAHANVKIHCQTTAFTPAEARTARRLAAAMKLELELTMAEDYTAGFGATIIDRSEPSTQEAGR